MKRINNKGFGKLELITSLGLIAVLLAIGSKLALDTGKSYGGFKTIANTFEKSVAMYKDYYDKVDNTYYLYELIEKGYIEELSNPMEPQEFCDKYNSFVVVPQPNEKQTTLVCGEYILEGVQSVGYKLYEVTSWSETKTNTDNERATIYNYKKNGEVVFDEYLPEVDFLQRYFEINKVMLDNPFDITNREGEELLTKKVYRTKTLIKELK